MPRYTVLLLPDVTLGGYTVEVPSLPGVVTEGDTRDEALSNAQEAIELFLEDILADGETIPMEPEDGRPELETVDVSLPRLDVADAQIETGLLRVLVLLSNEHDNIVRVARTPRVGAPIEQFASLRRSTFGTVTNAEAGHIVTAVEAELAQLTA